MGELLFLINQSFCDYLIDAKQMPNTLLTSFSTELKNQIGIWYETSFADNETCKSCFQRKSCFHWRRREPSDKVVMVEEELDGIDIYGIGKLVDLPRLMFIDEECGNLKIVVDGGELTRNNDRKKSSEVL